MKKVSISLLSLIMVLSLFIPPMEANADEAAATVVLDGKQMEFDVPPTIVDGRTLVPLRAIFEALGAEIEWNDQTKTVTAVREETEVELTIGSETATIDGRSISLDVPATIVGGRTLVPLRFVSESMGADVEWEAATRSIYIADEFENAVVMDIVDGDTVRVMIGDTEETLRLLLVDTPETQHPQLPIQEYGPEASQFAEDTLTKRYVQLEYDGPERDHYDRLLVHLWVDGQIFNQMLLENGLARIAYIYDPPYKHFDDYQAAEKRAKEAKKGIWSIPGYVTDEGFDTDFGESDEEQQEPSTEPEQPTPSEYFIDIASVDLGDEIVTIYNNGPEDIDMTGWKLISVKGNQTYEFPDGFILKAGTTVHIVSGRGAEHNPPEQLKWTGSYIWNNNGDPAELRNNEGELVDAIR